jgi:hypothetical protein
MPIRRRSQIAGGEDGVMGTSIRFARTCVCGVALAASMGAGTADAPAPDPATQPSASAVAPSADATTYTVRLSRPARIGDRYNYVADATVVQSMTANVCGRERTLRPSNISLHLEAVEQVLAVNARGEPSKATYAVTKCTKREGKLERTFLQPGRVLTATAGRWKSGIEANGERLTAREELALRAVVSLPNANDVSLDDAYGTAKPRHPGESWAVNAEALARLVSRQGVRVKREDVAGTVKFKALREADGVRHALVVGSATIRQWSPDPGYLPQGSKFVSGSAELKFTKLVPVDSASGPCLTDTFSEKDLLKLKTDDDAIAPDILVDGKVLRTTGVKRTPLGADPVASGQP